MAQQTFAAGTSDWRKSNSGGFQCKVGNRIFDLHREVVTGRRLGSQLIQSAPSMDLTPLLPQQCHVHFDTALDFMYGRPIALDLGNVFQLHQIAEVLQIAGLHELTLDSMQQQGNASDVAAAHLVSQTLHSDLPIKTKRRLLHSLPLHILHSELAELATIPEPAFRAETMQFVEVAKVTDSPMLANTANGVDGEAMRIFSRALDTDLPAHELRSLVKTLPVDVVQSELGRRLRLSASAQVQSAPVVTTVTNVSEPIAVADESDASRIFARALDANLPVGEMRSLVKTLPLHVVQAELGRRSRLSQAPALSKL